MVVTFLEAHVPTEKSAALKAAFEGAEDRRPAQMVQMFLSRCLHDETLWRAVATWQSMVALEEYRRSVETPTGVLLFRSVGAEPTLSIHDVVLSGGAK